MEKNCWRQHSFCQKLPIFFIKETTLVGWSYNPNDTSKKLWIWFNGNLQISTFHGFIITFLFEPDKRTIIQLYFQNSHLNWYVWHRSLIYSSVSLVHISCFRLFTPVQVFSYSHTHVPLKPRSNEQYKIAFNIWISTKSCPFRYLQFLQATCDFYWKSIFKCIVHAQYI